MDPFGLFSAAGSLVGGVLNLFGQKSANKSNDRNVAATNEANLQINRETNAANERNVAATNAANYRIMQEQNAFNLDMWNRNNEYNSPAAQRQRLLDAGINPLAGDMGNVPSTEITSAGANMQSPVAQSVTMSPVQVFNELAGLADSVSQASLNYAQADLLRSQARNTDSITETNSIENDWKKTFDYSDAKQRELMQTVSNLISDGKNVDSSTDLNEQQKSLINKQIQEIDSRISVNDINKAFTQAQINTEKLSQEQLRQQIQIAILTYQLNRSEITARIQNINSDTKLKNQSFRINEMSKYLTEQYGIMPEADLSYNVAALLLNPKSRENIINALPSLPSLPSSDALRETIKQFMRFSNINNKKGGTLESW